MNSFIPKRNKYKKNFRPRYQKKFANRNTILNFGNFGLKLLKGCWITSKQLESVRRTLSKPLKKLNGKLWVRIFPNQVVTKKPLEVRMGRGKGNPEFWVFQADAGTILFEIGNVDEKNAVEILNSCRPKLPVISKVIKC